MALTWWPVAVVGVICLAAAVALAVLPPLDRETRQLRPLANTARLTRLPEYARVARTRLMSTIVTIVLLLILFAAAVLASARPSGWWSSSRAEDAPHDIMLCVGQPVTDQTTAAFLSHFAAQARTYGTQRIGLTSPNRRVIPLTRDYAYAAETLSDIAEAGRAPADPEVSPAQRAAKRSAIASFSPAVSYLDYAPSVADLLALCITGLPPFDAPSTHRRSLIYLGPGELRAPDEQRPSLLDAQQVADMAEKAGIQVNLLATSPGAVRDIAESTGGQAVSLDTGDAGLTRALDGIAANPPDSAAKADTVTAWYGDTPSLPLTVAVVASALLALVLVVVRR
ncbi:hypothetical protein [Mycolicibacterium holsaticum]|uniref:VWFA domain-containing protein n=1 Tax=Mycolicibacterium holsaticum TaxID=152142 RepID=A0A1E3RV74_9MYCO|nr:hypothetical protein [Mycolicibacterium holsaticum]MDA4110116.1 hypothetical protein [Mycolicibacterium holsaticum DSM 44478 = JCM 12374]ODQ93738.1 hypothetical protein BHQ17_11930 [Mycolicibacterium holsaticum]QZA11972.1 hypothetical protein K3U96_22910 [Mycolicibacterium holsaticum DSM 44478 = JCM 12374]UNC10541.1 hypothetical protein H5U41_03905 [Mycolicibacterium holsaticum DSM 44478 = JCM 12374]